MQMFLIKVIHEVGVNKNVDIEAAHTWQGVQGVRHQATVGQPEFPVQPYEHKQEVQYVDQQSQSGPPPDIKEDTGDVANELDDS